MHIHRRPTIPDDRSIESELYLDRAWDHDAVAALIRSKSDHGEMPSFLFLGRKEAGLLRLHLAEAFGAEAVASLFDTYYMGLDVVEIDAESFLYTAGRKVVRTLQDPIARRPAWRDRETKALWQLRI
ncbi:MAG TPA: hypothetical protein VIM57_05995 [Luteolibacter sp.]